MEEIFQDEFVTWRHPTPVGIKVSEVFGMESKSGKLWLEMAKQIYSDAGDNFLEIRHYKNGAPYIEGLAARISISHTSHFLVVAMLPKTPELDLEKFNTRSAMGVDAERKDRNQVLKIREKFLNDEELAIISPDDTTANIMAWTAKEAAYKAAMTESLDFKNDLVIKKLPKLDLHPEQKGKTDLGEILFFKKEDKENEVYSLNLYSYESACCVVTIAFSGKCARFGGREAI